MISNSNISKIPQRVALLIDGENISSALAGQVLEQAGKFGTLVVKPVYGDVCGPQNWSSTSGFKLVHSGSGKNSADILLSIEATDLAHGGVIERFAIATSDSDFCHISHHLRERGFEVLGIGEHKAPDSFRKSCSEFVELFSKKPEQSNVDTEEQSDLLLDQNIRQVIKSNSNGQGLRITVLGVKMHSQFDIKISKRKEKTWRAYLKARPDQFNLDPRGPEARVRLK